MHQRCAAHTVNLCMTTDITKALKKALKQVKEFNENEDEDSDEENIFDEEIDLDVTFIDSAINYNAMHESTFRKCKDLWNKQSRSTHYADAIKEILSVYLCTPNDTRWNSLLDSSTQLLLFIKNKPREVREVFKKLKIDFLTANEIEFLDNYVSVSAI